MSKPSATLTITSSLLATALAGAGTAKVTQAEPMLETADHLGYTPEAYQAIGGAELTGAAGVLVGLRKRWVGIAASLGSTALFAAAVAEHVRNGDEFGDYAPAAGLLALSGTVLAQQITR
ncbi:MAG: DoxX family protein [Corynebacterium sp.]|uniref:DoxX family protein n=1 Tax=Corynebacterium sp. TaxID=1720 RepID=UPI003F9A3441